MVLPWRWLNRLVYWLGWLTLGFLLLVAGVLFTFFSTLPDAVNPSFEDLQAQAETRVKSRLEAPEAPYRWVPLRQVNRDLLYSVVLAEDARFFQHRGLDYDALLDAFITNLRRGETAFGGSTLTQQTVKNLFLTQEQTYYRKLQEAVLTRRLENRFSKNQILELYLNLAEFGPDIYGVDAASRHYFGKPPAAINAAEGAYLALLLPSPRRYHYTLFQNRNVTPGLERKYRRILMDMRHANYISQAQLNRYLPLIRKNDWPEGRR
ncbi:monofunctional biosynthetic peptidoglycan transglycosylase [Marinospirillum celere]|uniref:Monofunctional biosynthetic peptidoglycan transglycosylase n=1 Tax=Marinospirillum celere TaxID=1122252 RepID=A0A1I1FCI4_9GAMM|nr:monofunctional biosynthetic peptidoglycan transglycosylase [Marinospirillum celere]